MEEPTTPTGHQAPRADAGPGTAVHHAHDAERTRARLANFWGSPRHGTSYGLELLRAMVSSVTAQDLTHDQTVYCRGLCESNAAAYRTSDVWVAPHTMGQRIAAHPFLSGRGITAGNLEDLAPARDGFVYFPTPLHLFDCQPLYGLAWHMAGTGDDLTTDVETITATRHLLPLLAAHTKLPGTPYCPNGMATLHRNVLNGYSNPDTFGAPGPATILALLLTFWDLRLPAPAPDETDIPQTADEYIVTVLQHIVPGSKKTGRSGKNKRGSRAPAKRPIRIIREPAHMPGPSDPAGSTAAVPARRWKDDTLRWEVRAKSQNRCPNPHQHRAIIEAGGTCPPVKVPVRAHRNGPKGRDTDPRRTVRIVPDRRDRDA